jgi:hypothetical protein
VKSKDIGNRLAEASIKSFSINRLYKGLGFKVKELYNINYISSINKYKAICSRVSKGSKGYIKSIL